MIITESVKEIPLQMGKGNISVQDASRGLSSREVLVKVEKEVAADRLVKVESTHQRSPGESGEGDRRESLGEGVRRDSERRSKAPLSHHQSWPPKRPESFGEADRLGWQRCQWPADSQVLLRRRGYWQAHCRGRRKCC